MANAITKWNDIYTVKLDNSIMYQGLDPQEAIVIHGIITAVLYEKKISGIVIIEDYNDKIILDETWIDGVLVEDKSE